MTKVNWMNPYEKKGKYWLKGNLHTHTNTSGCSDVTLEQVIDIYEKMKYDYLAITNHGLAQKPDIKTKLILLAGIEIDFTGNYHTCVTNLSTEKIVFYPGMKQQEIIDENIKNGGFVVLNHPDWQEEEHYSLTELLALNNYSGMEIYNTCIERLYGSALSTLKWDWLLGRHKKVLGVANQDSHKIGDHKDCCNIVNVNEKTPESIFNALQTGNYYCHYGVEIIDIGRTGDKIHVKTKNAKLIRFVGQYGLVLKKVKGPSAEIDFNEADKECPEFFDYIRIECLGEGEEISWSQPFFRDDLPKNPKYEY